MNRKRNPFFVYGMVSPEEYDWMGQFSHAAKQAYLRGEVERIFDVGKVMGLADAYLRLLEKQKAQSASERNEEK